MQNFGAQLSTIVYVNTMYFCLLFTTTIFVTLFQIIFRKITSVVQKIFTISVCETINLTSKQFINDTKNKET